MGDPARNRAGEQRGRTFAAKDFREVNRVVVVGDVERRRSAPASLLELPLRVNVVDEPEDARFEPGTVDVIAETDLPEDLPFGSWTHAPGRRPSAISSGRRGWRGRGAWRGGDRADQQGSAAHRRPPLPRAHRDPRRPDRHAGLRDDARHRRAAVIHVYPRLTRAGDRARRTERVLDIIRLTHTLQPARRRDPPHRRRRPQPPRGGERPVRQRGPWTHRPRRRGRA